MGEWRRVRIGDFLHRVKHPVRLRDDETYKLVTVRMHHKGVVLRETKKGKLIGSNMFRVRSGQFILSGIDARHGAFGVIPDELDGAVVTNDFWYFDVDAAVVARDFFLWLTTTPLFLDACIKSSEGTTNRRRLQAERFFNFAFRFPDIAEQHRLAERFAAFDATHSALRGEFEVQSDFLKQLRQAVLQEAVEGKLTADWRKEFVETQNFASLQGDPQHDAAALLAQIKAEKERLVKAGKIRKEKPLPPIAESDKPFELPAGWVWCRIGQLGFVNPRNFIADEKLEVSFSPMPLISARYGVSPRFEKKLWQEIKSGFTHFAEGDVAIAKITPCFENSKSGVFRKLINGYGAGTTELHVLRPVLVISDYVHIFVKIENFLISGEKLMTGAVGQKRVPVDYFSGALIPLPPLAEQQAIVARVDSLMAMIDELEQQVAERKEQAQMLMQAVVREAFAGEEGVEGDDVYVGAQHAAPVSAIPRRARARHASPLREPADNRRAGLEPAPTETLPLVAEPSATYKTRGQAALPAANQPVPGGIPARILAAMQSNREYSRADLLAATGITESDWIWAIRQLKEQGRVVQKGERRGARYLR